ncbi:hypothetical protein EVAR_26842_1 [Eumeta japonica]|uniref:Uncharacterized protein n=1 Tax=Eumeta variegata TaxID=151549 RepID=A0A4C1VZ99_EUMVA|nr:hypothetical protein EVAR_26842_1 [Eumeta japonica]
MTAIKLDYLRARITVAELRGVNLAADTCNGRTSNAANFVIVLAPRGEKIVKQIWRGSRETERLTALILDNITERAPVTYLSEGTRAPAD